MTKVRCPCGECTHNNNNICTAKSITLGNRYVQIKYESGRDIWICNQYQLSKYAKQIYDGLKEIYDKKKDGDNNV